MKLIYIKSTITPKDCSVVREILKKERGEKLAPFIYKLNKLESLEKYLSKENINYEVYREEKPKKVSELEITSLEVHKNKIIAHLNNGGKPEIPTSWFTKWGIKGVSAEKLKKYEIWEGEEIYFPDLDEVLGIEKFTNGFDAPCE